MEYSDFYEEYGIPYKGKRLEKLIRFLAEDELTYDAEIEATINLMDPDHEIAATCSIHGNVLKCIAVDSSYQGCGLSLRIVTLAMNYALEHGHSHLFLFTKPKNKQMFREMGFHPIVETQAVVLMENKKNGIEDYVKGLNRGSEQKPIGAIVVNCNPFTYGHRYLIEQALASCATLHLFVLSEDLSYFSAKDRYQMVLEGVKDLPAVLVHGTSDYLISSVVFPTYFIKEKAKAAQINCELDLRIFCEHFAKELGITKRYVGTEPTCQVTNAYNRQMKELLSQYGIETVEIPRVESECEPISASTVRKCIENGDIEKVKRMVPPSTWDYISKNIEK